MRYFIIIMITAVISGYSHTALAGTLPPLLNFQSVLLDEGGNLLPSGDTLIHFQILDGNHTPLYSETQTVSVTKGAAAALIGNGNDDQGHATGGIPDDIFSSGEPRYLQVQVGTQAPEDPMTIVPVPYAQWSASCQTVADGAIQGSKIAKSAVGFEHLAPDVADKLLAGTTQNLTSYQQTLSAATGATTVGVDSKFINSDAKTVQGVLQDVDLAVKKRQEETTFLTSALNTEVTNRSNAVTDVQSKLDQEVKDRTSAVMGVQSQLTTEIQNRTTADTALQTQIANEVNARTSAVMGVQGKLDQEVKDRTTADTGLQGQITKEISDRSAAIISEANARASGDSVLSGNIGAINTKISDINNIPGTLNITKVVDAASKQYVNNEISKIPVIDINPLVPKYKAGSYTTTNTAPGVVIGFKPSHVTLTRNDGNEWFSGYQTSTTNMHGYIYKLDPGTGKVSICAFDVQLDSAGFTPLGIACGQVNPLIGNYYYAAWLE